MKKLCLYLFLAVMTVSLNSCSKDDDGGQNEASILGRWNFSEMVMNIQAVTEVGRVNIKVTATNDDNSIYGIFNENGTLGGQNGTMMAHMQVTGALNMSQDIPISNSLPVEGTWEKNGNLLTLKEVRGEETTYEIKTLNATTLELYTDQDIADFPFDILDEGVESFTANVIMKR